MELIVGLAEKIIDDLAVGSHDAATMIEWCLDQVKELLNVLTLRNVAAVAYL